jgi:hypothetical protein
MPVAHSAAKFERWRENIGGIVEKVSAHLPHDRNDRTFGRPFTHRRWPLKAVTGDGERYRAVELELVPDAIREFMDTLRREKRVAVAR